jgi:hypothetical protein
MLLRPWGVYPLHLPVTVLTARDTLVEDLHNPDSATWSQSVFGLLFALWSVKWIPLPDSPVTDPTLVYFMLSSIQKDGGFMEPKLITNIIARFQYLMRLVFLQAMHDNGNIEMAAEQLSVWFQEKHDSTFNSLRSLQHVASSISYSTISLPKIWWIDREHHRSLLYKGYPIQFSAFPAMFAAIEDEMVHLWQEELLCGLPLKVQYGRLYDDLQNTRPGYSFVTDERNTCFGNRMQLLQAILDTPDLYKRFVAYNSGGVIRWNVIAFRRWLAAYASFQRLQLMLVMMATGSPSRATEITALLLANTATNPMRNVTVFDTFVTILCTYQKTSALTGTDKCIPHALNGFSADLLVQDLAITRPFAEVAAHLSYPDTSNVIQLYRTHVFVNQNRLFDTDDLTAGLQEFTLKYLGVKLGVNGWRHVSTAFRRKICTRMEDLYEEDEMDNVQALQSGHNRQTENSVYALSADSAMGAPEDLLPRFLDASKDWQLACRLVPGGLGRSYIDCRASSFQVLLDAGTIDLVRGPSQNSHQDVLAAIHGLRAHFDHAMAKLLAHFPQTPQGKDFSAYCNFMPYIVESQCLLLPKCLCPRQTQWKPKHLAFYVGWWAIQQQTGLVQSKRRVFWPPFPCKGTLLQCWPRD